MLFPESAKLGLKEGQHDPGWWLLVMLSKFGLVTDLKLPHDLPERSELERVHEKQGKLRIACFSPRFGSGNQTQTTELKCPKPF